MSYNLNYYSPLFLKTFKRQIAVLPKHPIVHIDTTVKSKHIHQVDSNFYISGVGDAFAMSTISTYPIVNHKRDGNPIADRIGIVRYSNCTVGVVCDGCGWGERSAVAATQAIEESIQSIDKELSSAQTIRDLGKVLVKASSIAHASIVQKTNRKPFDIGTTTIQLSITVPHNNGSYSVVLLIGDCHCFTLNKEDMSYKDICGKWRVNNQTSNCGGRIGASSGLNPDLTGVELRFVEHKSNELILLSSDGFHDNFDIQISHKQPKDILLPLLHESVTLIDFIEQALNYVITTTKTARRVIQAKIRTIQPTAKLDHTSVLVYETNTFLSRTDLTTPLITLIPTMFSELYQETKPRPISFHSSNSPTTVFGFERNRSSSVSSIKKHEKIDSFQLSPFTLSPRTPKKAGLNLLKLPRSKGYSEKSSPRNYSLSPASNSTLSPISDSITPVGESFVHFFCGDNKN